MSPNSSYLTAAVKCNTNLQYVKDMLLTYYKTNYMTKNRTEEEKAYNATLKAFTDHVRKLAPRTGSTSSSSTSPPSPALSNTESVSGTESKRPDDGGDNKYDNYISDYSVGVRRLLSCVYRQSGTDIVPATLAGHLLLQNNCFLFADSFVHIPIAQAVAYLLGDDIKCIVYNGRVRAAIMNYVCRPSKYRHFDYWTMSSTKTLVSLKKRHKQFAKLPDGNVIRIFCVSKKSLSVL
jgi:hypothetical protein